MNPEVHNKLKRENLDDIKDGEIMDSKKRCPLSKISTSENTDPTLRALGLPEVLTRIVEHLSGDDFTNFRCVCKLWNEYSEPKFVFRFIFQDKEVAALLLNSGCRRMKLEFQDCPVGRISDDVWEKCGCKIRSLHFHCCEIEMNTLQSIISHCIALEELEICQKYYLWDFSPKISVVKLLDYFIERKERRTRLRALAVQDYQSIEISEFLKKTFTVFPCIVDLCCIFDGIHDDNEASSYSASDTNYDLQKLRSYIVVGQNDYLWSKNSIVPMLDYQLLRLKKFKTKLYLKDIFTDLTKKERLFQFFNVQKDLEVVDLETFYGFNDVSTADSEVFIKSLVFHILKSCSNLREFQLIGDSIKLAGEEIEEFFSLISNLQSLKCSYNFEIDASGKTVLQSSLPTLSLRVLRIPISQSYFFSAIKLSTQLRHLYITLDSDEQLRGIILALPNLQTLVLRLCKNVTNYGFTGENEESSIRRLQNLEYLYIIGPYYKCTKEIFEEFGFPRLKYLGLSLSDRKQLPEILSNMPELKTLNVHLREEYRWPTEDVITLCKSLRKLQHLIVEELVYQNETLVVEYFKPLSNLNLITSRDDITFMRTGNPEEACYFLTYKLEFFKNEFFGEIEYLY